MKNPANPVGPLSTLLSLAALTAAGCTAAQADLPPTPATAEYIANEGLVVSRGDTKIMFDPLPLSGFDVYPEPSSAQIEQMMSGEGPYADVDVVFISHAHSDHFSAKAIVNYLMAQRGVHIVMPSQALDMIAKEFPEMDTWEEDFKARMHVLDMEAGDAPQAVTIGDINAAAVRIPHAGWPDPRRASIQNMVYRVTLADGATVMHMGDADPRRAHYTPHQSHWSERRTDGAFPPYWFLTSETGRNILTDDLNVAASTGVHVPLEIPDELKASGQDFFSVPGEKREIGKPEALK
nr:beta-lactamase domain containing protein [uncultured bacterium]